MAKLRYPGDKRDSLPPVIGGRFLVLDVSYDATDDETTVTVRPLIDPKMLGERP